MTPMQIARNLASLLQPEWDTPSPELIKHVRVSAAEEHELILKYLDKE